MARTARTRGSARSAAGGRSKSAGTHGRGAAGSGGTVRGGKKKLGRGKRFSTGIDIGSYSVKIITLAGDDSGMAAVQAITVIPLPKPEGAEYAEEKQKRQVEALKEAVKKHGSLQGRVILGFPRELSTIRYLNMPSTNREELQEMVYYDAERHVPFPLNEMEISFQILEQLGEHESRVMMVAAPTNELEPYLIMCEEAGIDINSIDLDVLGDCEAYSRTAPPEETLAVVNFGRSTVNLGIVKGNELLFSRSLPVSEIRLLSGFSGAKTLKDLQGRVTAAGVLNPKEREHFSAWVEKLGMELMRSVSAFICEAPDARIGKMIFCGGAGYFPAGPPRGLSVKVKAKISVEPAMNGEIPPSDQYHGAELVTAIGLALRGLKPAQETLNLLPEEVIQFRARENRSTFRKNIMIFIFMIVVLLSGGGFLKWYERYEDYTQFNDFYGTLNRKASAVSNMNKKIKIVENYVDTKQSCINVLQKVMEILPPKTYISNISFSKRDTFELSGHVLKSGDITKISRLLINLRPSPDEPGIFSNVVPGEEQTTTLDLDSKQMQAYQFRIHCTLRWSVEAGISK